jgi:hypothetical protein
VLLSHLDDTEPLALAGDQVQRIHTAGLQAAACVRA